MNEQLDPRTGDDSSVTRRSPSGHVAGAPATGSHTGPSTSGRIIRRAPTGRMPVVTHAGHIGGPPTVARGSMARPADMSAAAEFPEPPGLSVKAAATTCVVAIISGWATSVVSTDLIAGWWHTDRLFCAAVAFLTLVFAVTTISGVIMLMRRRLLGRYLITAGAVVALLTFLSVFIAGARVPWIVHTIPVLQIASGVLAMHPANRRWCLPGT